MCIEELLANLRIDAEWAEANEWDAPIGLLEDLQEAISVIEKIMEDNENATE